MTPSPAALDATPDADVLRASLRDLKTPIRVGAAQAPALLPEALGDPAFRREHGVRYAYATGAMANGIASEALVQAGAKAGLLSFFGAAGLSLERVEAAIDQLSRALGSAPHGFNLIHSPSEPALEEAVADLYLRRGVRLVEASAFMGLTPAIVRYRLSGLRRGADGRVEAPNKVVAKVSRAEVAEKFLSPAPEALRRELAAAGLITASEAELGAEIPLAQDVTVEADSGGHTDNRPLVSLLPAIIALRDRVASRHRYKNPPRVGAAGGIATPASVAAAYMMGAAYVLTGSINQACVESGTSDQVRGMLAQAGQADVAMAPAADMFEMGVKVQILKRGTMFAMRAAKLYELYRAHDSLGGAARRGARGPGARSLPRAARGRLEQDARVFPEARPGAGRARRARAQTQAIACVPFISRAGLALGQRGRARPRARLPGLVRPRHGRLQRMGRGVFPAGAREPPRGARRPQPALWRRRPDPRPFPALLGSGPRPRGRARRAVDRRRARSHSRLAARPGLLGGIVS